MLARCRIASVLFMLALLAACESDGVPIIREGVHAQPLPPASRSEAQAIAEQFDSLVSRLEIMTLPPQPLDRPGRRRLRGELDYLLAYLDAPSWRGERILQLERRIAKIEIDRTGVYSGDVQEFSRQWDASESEIGRIRADIRTLRAAQAAAANDAAPSIVLPLAITRSRDAVATSGSREDIIAEMEALLVPPGRLHVGDKQVLRARLNTLVAFLSVPWTRADEIDELKNQVAVLQRFQRVGPVEGSHKLYDDYRRAIQAEAERLRARIRALETAGD